jgi:hypothetical protein
MDASTPSSQRVRRNLNRRQSKCCRPGGGGENKVSAAECITAAVVIVIAADGDRAFRRGRRRAASAVAGETCSIRLSPEAEEAWVAGVYVRWSWRSPESIFGGVCV